MTVAIAGECDPDRGYLDDLISARKLACPYFILYVQSGTWQHDQKHWRCCTPNTSVRGMARRGGALELYFEPPDKTISAHRRFATHARALRYGTRHKIRTTIGCRRRHHTPNVMSLTKSASVSLLSGVAHNEDRGPSRRADFLVKSCW